MMTKEEKKELSLNTKYFADPKALTNILQYVPKDKYIWNCWEQSTDVKYQRLPTGYDYAEVDLFDKFDCDLILCNREFGESEKTMDRLLELDIPFITLLPTQKMGTKYMRKWADKKLQIIVPNSRIKFHKYVYGKLFVDDKGAGANYDCFYYCYGLNLPNDITFMEEEKKPAKPTKGDKARAKADETVDLIEKAKQEAEKIQKEKDAEKDAEIADLKRQLEEAKAEAKKKLPRVEEEEEVVTTVEAKKKRKKLLIVEEEEEVVTTVEEEEEVVNLPYEIVNTIFQKDILGNEKRMKELRRKHNLRYSDQQELINRYALEILQSQSQGDETKCKMDCKILPVIRHKLGLLWENHKDDLARKRAAKAAKTRRANDMRVKEYWANK